jgi:branched-chain amino acid transport system substrate-binding protein
MAVSKPTRSISRWPVAILALCAIAAGLYFWHGRAPSVVTLGAVLPLTGDAATFGRNAEQGARLAVEEANERHLVPGRTVEFKVEDSRGAAADAVAATHKLIDVSGAKLMIADVTSAGTHAILPIVDQAKVPLVSPAASDPKLAGKSPMFSRVWPSDVYEAEVIGNYALRKAYSAIAVLYANTDYGVAMVDQFTKLIPPQKIAMRVPLERETLDYRPTVQRLKLAKIDSIFMVFYPEDAKRLLQQLAEQQLAVPILATATFEDPSLAHERGADRVVFATPAPPAADDLRRQQFVQQYKARFGAEPGVLSDTGYDAAMILIQAYAAKDGDGPAASAYIHSLSGYTGVSGLMTFDASGDVKKPYRLRTVVGGKFDWLPADGGNAAGGTDGRP